MKQNLLAVRHLVTTDVDNNLLILHHIILFII